MFRQSPSNNQRPAGPSSHQPTEEQQRMAEHQFLWPDDLPLPNSPQPSLFPTTPPGPNDIDEDVEHLPLPTYPGSSNEFAWAEDMDETYFQSPPHFAEIRLPAPGASEFATPSATHGPGGLFSNLNLPRRERVRERVPSASPRLNIRITLPANFVQIGRRLRNIGLDPFDELVAYHNGDGLYGSRPEARFGEWLPPPSPPTIVDHMPTVEETVLPAPPAIDEAAQAEREMWRQLREDARRTYRAAHPPRDNTTEDHRTRTVPVEMSTPRQDNGVGFFDPDARPRAPARPRRTVNRLNVIPDTPVRRPTRLDEQLERARTYALDRMDGVGHLQANSRPINMAATIEASRGRYDPRSAFSPTPAPSPEETNPFELNDQEIQATLQRLMATEADTIRQRLDRHTLAWLEREQEAMDDGDLGWVEAVQQLFRQQLEATDQEVQLLEQRLGLPAHGRVTIDDLRTRQVTAEDFHQGECECPICKGDLAVREQVTLTTCDHFFHRECLAHWLGSSTTCPSCRRHQTGAGNPGSSRNQHDSPPTPPTI